MLPREERHDSCSEPGAHGLCEDLSPLDPHPSFCDGALAWALSLESRSPGAAEVEEGAAEEVEGAAEVEEGAA
eukprot:CAMPEP_0181231268 /NCGR_PEP_ID=MMETSP1096-20121128/34999_1 /TAXON_ID=156174 ORGANISM="Chrysochromulina ericina, Strain CCMP281" /NCGR_SAMPLE_ID=MMETSP1096 /ASSEMBLY_ACC=CAM_ASM_000453 /LENGTH=72 /DNA_ID=CAMNT_0023325265 /DNA_START=322 /DNA_END=537 /DNA_ORIENTATION=-